MRLDKHGSPRQKGLPDTDHRLDSQLETVPACIVSEKSKGAVSGQKVAAETSSASPYRKGVSSSFLRRPAETASTASKYRSHDMSVKFASCRRSPFKSRKLKTYVIRLEKLFTSSCGKDHVYLAGVLEKYHPGFAIAFVARSCQVRQDCLQYSAVSSGKPRLPLMRLPFSDIESVSRVNVSFPGKMGIKTGLHQFEVVMRGDWSLGKSKSELRASFPAQPEDRGNDSRMARSQSVISRASVPGRVDYGHIMPRPTMLGAYQTGRVEFPPGATGDKKRQQWVVDGVQFVDEKEAARYKRYVRENAESLGRVGPTQTVSAKNPNAWISGISGLSTWNNRALEWYLAEQRMLFAAGSEDDCNRWVFLLNWLLMRSCERSAL